MARRLILVGLMVLAQDSMMQITMGTLLAATFLLFQVQAVPYREMSDAFLANAASFALVVVFVIMYAFKDYEFVGLPDITAKMSKEQRTYYVVPQGLLTLVLVACTVGALVLSFVLFLVQLAMERARRRAEQRANRARRLRNKITDEEVQLKDSYALSDDTWHLFLSRAPQVP